MRKSIPNLLIVAGDGRNCGKTAMVARLLKQLGGMPITAVKISPHFHKPSEGLKLLEEREGFRIFEETNWWSAKDSSRMLQAGAARVFYCQVAEGMITEAFGRLSGYITDKSPVVCESPSLALYYEPGVMIMMTGSDTPGREAGELLNLSHIRYTIDDLDRSTSLPFRFSGGAWQEI